MRVLKIVHLIPDHLPFWPPSFYIYSCHSLNFTVWIIKASRGFYLSFSGDLPETLDAFYAADGDDPLFPENHEEAPTVVRKRAIPVKKTTEEEKKHLDKVKKEAEIQARYDVWNRG